VHKHQADDNKVQNDERHNGCTGGLIARSSSRQEEVVAGGVALLKINETISFF
jgi:hypothetical protein